MKKKNTGRLVLHKSTLCHLRPQHTNLLRGGATFAGCGTQPPLCEDSFPAGSCLYECPTDVSCIDSCQGSCGTCVTCAWTTPCYTCCC